MLQRLQLLLCVLNGSFEFMKVQYSIIIIISFKNEFEQFLLLFHINFKLFAKKLASLSQLHPVHKKISVSVNFVKNILEILIRYCFIFSWSFDAPACLLNITNYSLIYSKISCVHITLKLLTKNSSSSTCEFCLSSASKSSSLLFTW